MIKVFILSLICFFVINEADISKILLDDDIFEKESNVVTENKETDFKATSGKYENALFDTPQYNAYLTDNDKALILYKELLNGQRTVLYGEKNIDINELISFEKNVKLYEAKYALFDTNGDDLLELHIRSKSHYFIISYKNNDLYIFANLSIYCTQLDNGAFLSIRDGGTPTHTNYVYIILDYSGEIFFSLHFAKYDANQDGAYDENDCYYFEGVEVSKTVWDELTKKYLEIGSSKIEWVSISYEG